MTTPAALLAALPLTLGVRVRGGLLEPLLRRGSALPARARRVFTTTADDQAVACVRLYAGERPFCEDARPLAFLELTPLLSPSHRGFLRLEVALEVTADGRVALQASDLDAALVAAEPAVAFWQGALSDAAAAGGAFGAEEAEISVFDEEMAARMPALRPVRLVRLCEGRDVAVRQSVRQGGAGTGGAVWGCALALAEVIEAGELAGLPLGPGLRALELGAGPGLVAMALALRGVSVLATDADEVALEGLVANVGACERAGSLPGSVATQRLQWGLPSDEERAAAMGPWDLLVGSDILYPGICKEGAGPSRPAHELLLGTLGRLLGQSASACAVLALQDRDGEVERFLGLLRPERWAWKTWSPARHPSVVVIELRAAEPSDL